MRWMMLPLAFTLGVMMMNAAGSTEVRCCPTLELRQYTLKPGQREVLIDIFERHFIESQEALGMTVVGQFRDRRRADKFVWLRGFSDMESRRTALEAFYAGPIWAAHKAEANNTMLDTDDVLLLKPARTDLTFRVDRGAVGPISEEQNPATILAGIYQLPQPADDRLVSQFELEVMPILQAHGVHIEGVFVTESARNTFTNLPVREGEHVLVWFGILQGAETPLGWLDRLARLSTLGTRPMTLLDLEPTPRSVLGHGPKAARAMKSRF